MIAQLISGIHLLIAFYFILIPLIATNKNILRDYLILSAFLWLHWITNNDTCALTLLESHLTNLPKNQTFFGRLFGPVYLVTSKQIYAIHATLILLAIFKYLRE